MTRPQMGLLAWIGVIIVLGLLLTHQRGTQQLATSSFSGIEGIIKDLQNPQQPGIAH